MTENAIMVEGLGKEYRLGGARRPYRTVRDGLAGLFRAPFRRSRHRAGAASGTFWALQDVSFEVAAGEVVGVIGRNGAGKSTLLKILSRVTSPTRGTADLCGRVGALLEVGTGFHLELTGRENVALNGAILGMSRAEIERKFDEIVAFAQVEKFIDTPVKHYSSGMQLRLGFSVAAHLEPEILLIDEVLAVGDLAFQKRCLGKMETIAASGRTVLFVSHNLSAVKELCQTSLVLEGGRVLFRGDVVEGIARYSEGVMSDERRDAISTGWGRTGVRGHEAGFAAPVQPEEPVAFETDFAVAEELSHTRLFFILEDSSGTQLVHRRIDADEGYAELRQPGLYRVTVELPALWLAPGLYSAHFKLIATTEAGEDVRRQSERVLVDVGGPSFGLSRALLSPRAEWSVAPLEVGEKCAQ